MTKFLALRSAIHSALVVAPKDAGNALDDDLRTNIHMTAVLLKTTAADRPEEVPRVQMHQWREALQRVKTAMRADVASLSG
jgi:hypothetical protein